MRFRDITKFQDFARILLRRAGSAAALDVLRGPQRAWKTKPPQDPAQRDALLAAAAAKRKRRQARNIQNQINQSIGKLGYGKDQNRFRVISATGDGSSRYMGKVTPPVIFDEITDFPT